MSKLPPILDACCGSRMFWFDKQSSGAVFVDKRRETLVCDSRQGRRAIEVSPDIVADFKELPFPSESFHLVVFDPPHLTRNGRSSWMAKKYGTLGQDWESEIRQGFVECFRVLKEHGTLIFKWNETDIPVSRILKLTDEKPLFGHRSGKTQKTHWLCFMKGVPS